MNRHDHEPISHKKRAANYRAAARECEARGYEGIARVNWEMAEVLDPTPREVVEPKRRTRRGPDQSRVGARQDAPPLSAVRRPGYRGERAQRAANGALGAVANTRTPVAPVRRPGVAIGTPR